jgi:hypothetical protein
MRDKPYYIVKKKMVRYLHQQHGIPVTENIEGGGPGNST